MDRTFACRLADLRKSTGQSQKDAAAALQVSQALLSHYENGIRECRLGFVTRAAAHYDVTCDYLLGVSSFKRAHTEGVLSTQDIPEDIELNALTLFRILTVLREKLRDQPPSYRDVALNYFSMVIYRFLILAVNAGDLPRSWIGENTPAENGAFLECLSCLENVLLDSIEKGPQRVSDSQVPLCVKTLVSEAESYIFTQIESMYNSLGG